MMPVSRPEGNTQIIRLSRTMTRIVLGLVLPQKLAHHARAVLCERRFRHWSIVRFDLIQSVLHRIPAVVCRFVVVDICSWRLGI